MKWYCVHEWRFFIGTAMLKFGRSEKSHYLHFFVACELNISKNELISFTANFEFSHASLWTLVLNRIA
jgi:hypothetical protein